MFKSMDTDNSGTITFEELKAGLAKQGANLAESEVRQLMEAVSVSPFLFFILCTGCVLVYTRKKL
jgi:Ca2+-binding EF-hand superfamily protein